MLPERLAATVKSYKADADAFPWQRIENQCRTLVSIFRIHITADDARGRADSVGDVAGLGHRQRLLCLALASFRA